MQPSSELRDTMLRFYQAAASGDLTALDRTQSTEPGALMIGSDPDEWWEGGEAIALAWRAQIEALGGGMPIAAGNPQCWEEGNVGWAADRPVLRAPGQPDAPFRVTAVFHREGGTWKVVQVHASLGVPNEERFGQELPMG